jgi:hypothetical protein
VKWDEVIVENKKGMGGGGDMAHVAIFRGKMYEFSNIEIRRFSRLPNLRQESFTFSFSPTCSQIWLSLLVDNHCINYLKKFEKKIFYYYFIKINWSLVQGQLQHVSVK